MFSYQKGAFMAAALATTPPDADPPDDPWDFEPAADENFQFDPADDRKWDAFLLDEDNLDLPPEDFVPM